jgi:hypothetical protein
VSVIRAELKSEKFYHCLERVTIAML